MGEIFKHLKKPEWGGMIVCLIFIVTQVWLDLKLPDYMSEITRLVQTEGSAMGDIWVQGSYMLFCALGSLISAVILVFSQHVLPQHYQNDFEKVYTPK